ncbi:hypothetical protein, partial [Pseudomonas palleroniana]|uniref:hypothetical protein n=1 Tax=Pseudomonas palleroniana TaxID=191390 RepID=UPI001BAF79A9
MEKGTLGRRPIKPTLCDEYGQHGRSLAPAGRRRVNRRLIASRHCVFHLLRSKALSMRRLFLLWLFLISGLA